MKNSIKKLALFSAIAAGVLMTSGCASIVSKWKYPVRIESEPSGAHFTVKNRDGNVVATGTTPQTVKLDAGYSYFRREYYVVDFSMTAPQNFSYSESQNRGNAENLFAGTPATSLEIRAKMDPWYWLNIVIGGAIGMVIVDPLTGAMYKLPESCTGNLSEGNSEDIRKRSRRNIRW